MRISLVAPSIDRGRARMAGAPDAARARLAALAADDDSATHRDRDPGASAPTRRRVLIVDADLTLFELLQEWLAEQGYCLERTATPADAAQRRFDLIIVDVPCPRHGGTEALRRIARQHGGTPILVLSAALFTAAEGGGAVAQSLGVAWVLAKPLRREALIAAAARLTAAA